MLYKGARKPLAEMVKAETLDPLSQIIMMAHGWVFYMTRQYDRAIVQLRRTLDAHPGFWLAKGWLSLACGRKGMHSEAVAECTRAVELSGGLPLMEAALGCAQALSGNREEALKTVGRLREVSGQGLGSPPSRPSPARR